MYNHFICMAKIHDIIANLGAMNVKMVELVVAPKFLNVYFEC